MHFGSSSSGSRVYRNPATTNVATTSPGANSRLPCGTCVFTGLTLASVLVHSHQFNDTASQYLLLHSCLTTPLFTPTSRCIETHEYHLYCPA
jgi:hypothetical protein